MSSNVPLKTKIMMGLYFLLCGIEYAVILPTINGFILSFDGSQSYLGIILASFSLTGLVSAPIFGRISDKLQSAKWCIMIGNLFEIGGNFMYFASKNVYMIWGARLVAGVGSGGASCIFGVVSKKTTEKDRTAVFSLLMSSRQFGLIIGPGFNLFLEKVKFNFAHFPVNEYTSPGLFMSVLWLFHTVLWTALYNDKEDLSVPVYEEVPQNGVAANGEIIRKPRLDSFANAPCITKDVNSARDESQRMNRSLSFHEMDSIKMILLSFVREEVIVCLASTFLLMFAQTGLETALTPITKIYFNWGGFMNSIFFCICGVTVILSFLALSLVSRRVSDRRLLLGGTIALLVVYTMFFIYITVLYNQTELSPPWLLPCFISNSIFLTIVLPFAWVPQAALFSKVTKKETQGFNQGFRLLFMGLGQILGPLWAASLVDHLPIMTGVDLGLVVMLVTMQILSFDRLVGPNEGSELPQVGASSNGAVLYESDEENQPLLTNRNTINA